VTFVFLCRFIIALSGSIGVVIVAPFKAAAPQEVFGFHQYARLHREWFYQSATSSPTSAHSPRVAPVAQGNRLPDIATENAALGDVCEVSGCRGRAGLAQLARYGARCLGLG